MHVTNGRFIIDENRNFSTMNDDRKVTEPNMDDTKLLILSGEKNWKSFLMSSPENKSVHDDIVGFENSLNNFWEDACFSGIKAVVCLRVDEEADIDEKNGYILFRERKAMS